MVCMSVQRVWQIVLALERRFSHALTLWVERARYFLFFFRGMEDMGMGWGKLSGR
jgi:hypothetical protein